LKLKYRFLKYHIVFVFKIQKINGDSNLNATSLIVFYIHTINKLKICYVYCYVLLSIGFGFKDLSTFAIFNVLKTYYILFLL